MGWPYRAHQWAIARATGYARPGGIACPSWLQRLFFVLPQKTHPSGNPCRMAAAFSLMTTASGSERAANDSSWCPGGASLSSACTVVAGRSHGHAKTHAPCAPRPSPLVVTV